MSSRSLSAAAFRFLVSDSCTSLGSACNFFALPKMKWPSQVWPVSEQYFCTS